MTRRLRTVLLVLLAAFTGACARPPGPHEAPFYRVYLSGRHDIAAHLVDLVDGAREEVLVATFGASLHSLLTALERAARRGVRVELATDARAAGYLHFFSPGEVHLPGEGGGLMHMKFGVIDRQTAWIGSPNLTFGGAYRHNEDLLVFDSRTLAGHLAAVFNALTGRGPAPGPLAKERDGTALAVYTTPDCHPALLAALAGARREIFFSLYVLTDPEIKSLLAEQAGRGLAVSGVLEPGMHHNRAAGDFLAGTKVNLAWQRPPRLNHHKLFVIDRRTIITGSYNPSRAARRNREIMIVIEDPAAAAYYLDGIRRPRP